MASGKTDSTSFLMTRIPPNFLLLAWIAPVAGGSAWQPYEDNVVDGQGLAVFQVGTGADRLSHAGAAHGWALPGCWSATVNGDGTFVRWEADGVTAKVAVQARSGNQWRTVRIASSSSNGITIPRADAVAVTALDRFGNASPPKVLGIRY